MNKELIRDFELDIIVKAWRDEKFRQSLLKDPKKAIEKEFQLSVPSNMQIFVHEEHEDALHLIVPSVPSNFSSEDLSDDELRDVIGGVLSTGHFSFLNRHDRHMLRNLQKENDEHKKLIEKLKEDLALGNKAKP